MPQYSTVTVPIELHGQRIDSILAQLLPQYSRSQWCTWLKQGLVTVDDKLTKPKSKVDSNASINISETCEHYAITVNTSIPQAMPLDIVYEDDWLLIINKPAGLIVHPGAGNPRNTLVNGLIYYAKDLQYLPRAGIIHRLDKDTTGLLIVAKTLVAYNYLIKQLQLRAIKRQYLALVCGNVISGATVATKFGRNPHNRLKMMVCSTGKDAITHYTVNQRYQWLTLVNVTLETGRTHQIRVHMAYKNHPIFGDPLYGKTIGYPSHWAHEDSQLLRSFSRQALHAQTLSVPHPQNGSHITIKTRIPDDFQSILTKLKSYSE